jgi:hypothetical protein
MAFLHKTVQYRHKKRTISKANKQYIKTIIHNLSLQRWTDQEISDYLKKEKKIEISRSRITTIKNNIEAEAEKWYIELRESRYKYIATYKERLDSLLSYQRKLNSIVEFCTINNLNHETMIKAISELHRIELSLFNIWKQLPVISYSNSEVKVPQLEQLKQELEQQFQRQLQEAKEEEIGLTAMPWDDHDWFQCKDCKRWFKHELIDNCCHNCTPLPEPII